MNDSPDSKILSMALWYIGKHSMNQSDWRWTRVGDAHSEVLASASLLPGELPIVSFYASSFSWYLLTTRRILGNYSACTIELAALDVVKDDFGNSKSSAGIEVMTLQTSRGSEVKLEYETSFASMAPIYYFAFWHRKYPFVH